MTDLNSSSNLQHVSIQATSESWSEVAELRFLHKLSSSRGGDPPATRHGHNWLDFRLQFEAAEWQQPETYTTLYRGCLLEERSLAVKDKPSGTASSSQSVKRLTASYQGYWLYPPQLEPSCQVSKLPAAAPSSAPARASVEGASSMMTCACFSHCDL